MTSDRYFDFLRFALGADSAVPKDISSMDWQELYAFGLRQSLSGVLFQGIKKLPEGESPPQGLLMQWVMISNEIRRQNIRVNAVASEIFSLFTSAGFRCCILKGQGNALMYDDVYSRASGDVDIWLCGYADPKAQGGFVYPSRKVMSKKVIDYCREHFHIEQTRGHHTAFDYKGVEVEAHFAASERANPIYNKRYKEWFMKYAAEQCDNYVLLPEEDRRIAVPTLSFNLVYQIIHLFHHFFDMGIGMRQIVDYWLLLTKHESSKELKTRTREDLQHLGLLPFAAAVMWVLQTTLHLRKERMIVEPDERRGKLLLSEIITGGNFGKFDTKYGDITHKSIGGKYFTKTYRNLSFLSYYPEEALCEPIYRTYHFFLRHAKGWE